MEALSKYPKGIEVIVGAFILNEKNELLLCTSPKWKDEWIVPGGHVEAGESLENALMREISEELGVKIEIIDLFSISENFVSPPEFKRNAHFLFFDFAAKLTSNQFLCNDEVEKYQWFSLETVTTSSEVKESCQIAAAKLKKWLTKKEGNA